MLLHQVYTTPSIRNYARLLLVTVFFLVLISTSQTIQAEEVDFPSSAMAQLERFEAHQLGEANKAFDDGKYRQAESAYAAFLSEFPDSAALPYVILRLGRSLHLDKKRYEAIRTYREVLDYFPNNIRYAAAALFHTGEAHWENGDVEKALRSWITLAEDKEYSKQPLAARAINRLGDQFVAEDRWDRAVEYYRQVAVTFQREDRKVFTHARDRVIRYYLRHQPDEPKLREFYRDVQGFDNRRPRELPESLDEDREYWSQINRQVDRHDRFDRDEEKQKQAYFRYWTEQLDDRFPDWDDYHIRLAEHFKKLEANDRLWVKRLDKLFERNQEKGDNQRIIRWISLLQNYPAKIEAYYNRLDFSQMDNEAIFDLLQIVFKEVGNDRMASNVFGRLQLDTMGDDFRSRIVAFLAKQEREEMILRVIGQYRDGDRALRDLLAYYHNIGEVKKGVETARELVVVPEYAEFAYWRMAELLQEDGQYKEAIQAYRMVDDAPSNMWRIADCFQALGEVEQAVSTLRQVENFLEKYQAEAALRIAKVYGQAGQKDQQLAALRAVLSRYPESSQSRRAHIDLEALGYTRLGGGVEEDD